MTVNLFIMCFSPAKQAEYNPTGVSFEDTTDALPSHVITETGAMEVSSDQQTTFSRTAASQQDPQGSVGYSIVISIMMMMMMIVIIVIFIPHESKHITELKV